MKSSHILASFYFEPWNLRPDIHANFGRILQKHLAGEPVAERLTPARSQPLAGPHTGQPIVGPCDPWGNPFVPQMAVQSGVAVIPIYGALGKRLDTMDLRCGGVDYDNISEFAAMAAYDPQITTVILDIDSPGGSCRGLPECFDVLQNLAQSKNVIAYSEGNMCSAAYYLACAAQEIYASPSASVGNIGTVLAAQDTSREWEMNGWRLELFASGALKGIGFDGKAWTSAERDFFAGWMQKKFDEFKCVVTCNRPEVAQECFDGRWLDGDICPAYGLTDGVAMNLQALVAAALATAGVM